MSRYLWVVRAGGFYLGSDCVSITTTLITAHLFHSASEADEYCPEGGEVLKVIAYVEELH